MVAYINMKIKLHLLFMILVIPVIYSDEPFNYCTIQSCDLGTHTLCTYNISTISWINCNDVIRRDLTLSEKNRIVNIHNYFRWIVHNGYEERGRPGPQPVAALVTGLEWDDELAEAAQAWVQQCPNTVDQCRNVLRFPVYQSVGTNRTRGYMRELSLEGIISKWYNEVERFNASEVYNYSELSGYRWTTAHYTQMVWETTEKIGCARIIYHNRFEYVMTLVCNYGPSGNNEGEQVYTVENPENSIPGF